MFNSIAAVEAALQYPVFVVKNGTLTQTAFYFTTQFYLAGHPPAASVPPATSLSGTALTSYAGQIPFTNPVSGSKTYLAGFRAIAEGQVGTASQMLGAVLLCDRLWHVSGIDITTTAVQTINSVAWPARDVNGTSNGEGVFIGMEVTPAVGAGAPTATMTYTNSDGVSGRVGTSLWLTPGANNGGLVLLMGLDNGDIGVRSIQNFSLSNSWTSGGIVLFAYRVIAWVDLNTPGQASAAVDAITGGFPVLYDNSVLMLLSYAGRTALNHTAATILFAQG